MSWRPIQARPRCAVCERLEEGAGEARRVDPSAGVAFEGEPRQLCR